MNLNHTEETIALVKASLHMKKDKPFAAAGSWQINFLRTTKYWDAKNSKLNRRLLLEDLATNPWVIRNLAGVGEQTESEVFQYLLATVGEK